DEQTAKHALGSSRGRCSSRQDSIQTHNVISFTLAEVRDDSGTTFIRGSDSTCGERAPTVEQVVCQLLARSYSAKSRWLRAGAETMKCVSHRPEVFDGRRCLRSNALDRVLVHQVPFQSRHVRSVGGSGDQNKFGNVSV